MDLCQDNLPTEDIHCLFYITKLEKIELCDRTYDLSIIANARAQDVKGYVYMECKECHKPVVLMKIYPTGMGYASLKCCELKYELPVPALRKWKLLFESCDMTESLMCRLVTRQVAKSVII